MMAGLPSLPGPNVDIPGPGNILTDDHYVSVAASSHPMSGQEDVR